MPNFTLLETLQCSLHSKPTLGVLSAHFCANQKMLGWVSYSTGVSETP